MAVLVDPAATAIVLPAPTALQLSATVLPTAAATQPSAEILLLQKAGFPITDLAPAKKVFTGTIDNDTFVVIRYIGGEGVGMQLVQDDRLVVDPDIARRMLTLFAWSDIVRNMTNKETVSLVSLQQRLQNLQERTSPITEVVVKVDPLLAVIDKLKQRPVKFGPIATNTWDAVCSIPIDVSDLCLLEPPLRLLRDLSIEADLLIDRASIDLDNTVGIFGQYRTGGTPDGNEARTATIRSIESLNVIYRRLIRLSYQIATVQGHINRATAEIEKHPQIQRLVDDLSSLLVQVNDRADSWRETIERGADALQDRALLLDDVKLSADDKLQMLRRQWQYRPS